eukprot:4862328-Prymnesium_polylepis.1
MGGGCAGGGGLGGGGDGGGAGGGNGGGGDSGGDGGSCSLIARPSVSLSRPWSIDPLTSCDETLTCGRSADGRSSGAESCRSAAEPEPCGRSASECL